MSQLIEPLEPTAPSRIGQLAIPVADLDRAVRFYEETLGLRLLFRAPPSLAAVSPSSTCRTWSPVCPTMSCG